MRRNRMGGGKTKGWKRDRGEVRGREQRGLEEERVREMSPREVRLSWEQRKGQGGWARGGCRNAEEGRAEVAASRVGNAAGGRQAKRQQELSEGRHR